MRTLADALRWTAQGTDLVRRALAASGSTDADLEAASALPGWTRKHLLAHLAANADAVGNLVHWAATGERTPMYASTEQRNADIEAGARRAAGELVAWFEGSAAALRAAFAALTEEAWAREVVTAQGRTVAASETPWMRAREAMVHAVDLDAGLTFADLPADFLAALGTDIAGKRAASGGLALEIEASDADARWALPGEGTAVRVSGPIAQVVAYLAGRPFHDVTDADGAPAPILPPWL